MTQLSPYCNTPTEDHDILPDGKRKRNNVFAHVEYQAADRKRKYVVAHVTNLKIGICLTKNLVVLQPEKE